MKTYHLSFLILSLMLLLTACSNPFQSSLPKGTLAYQCPMKCEGAKTYAQEGRCPVCHMKLKEITVEKTSGNKNTSLRISGAMHNVMHKGELFGTIALDTINDKTHLYGLGPFEYLQGEILIDDGTCYLSKVADNGSLHIEESYQMKAPFFVYDNVFKWKEVKMPDTVQNIRQLENYLEQSTQAQPRPFAFKVLTTIDSGAIHIVNLPVGTAVHSPDDVRKHHVSFDLENESSTLIGFFSTEHQGIFTHHDTYVHIHLLTDDHKKMGHLDHAHWQSGTARLFLPSSL